MFQTELLIWIQSGATEFWTLFFSFWSLYTSWVIPVVLVVFFGINARAGFVLIQALFWDMTASLNLKQAVMLPRPSSVDSRVALLGQEAPNPTPFRARGAAGFWEGLPPDVVQAIRADPFDSWGLPSGHTSSATTFAGLCLKLFPRSWIRLLCCVILVCVPLSRLYLGRHFLADILAGYLIGALVALFFYFAVYRREWFRDFFASRWSRTPWNMKTVALCTALIIAPPVFLLLPGTPWEGAGAVLGFNLGYLWVRFRGMPSDLGSWAQRLGRILTAGILYGILEGAGRCLGLLISPADPPVFRFVRGVIVLALLVRGTVGICIKLGLYRPPD